MSNVKLICYSYDLKASETAFKMTEQGRVFGSQVFCNYTIKEKKALATKVKNVNKRTIMIQRN